MLTPSKSCQIKNLAEIYDKYFGSIASGSFVEIGAYDGDSFSNTSCLADAGWSGIYVEPVVSFYTKCKKRHEHNNVKVLNYSVGQEEKEIALFVAGPITSTSNTQMSMYQEVGWLKDRATSQTVCQQITLERILSENNVPFNFELLVVDVEGNEYDVIRSFELAEWMPRMLIIELEDMHPTFVKYTEHRAEHADLREYILSKGYDTVYKDSINTVFFK